EAEVSRLLTPAQQVRLRQIGLQAEGPGAFAEPEVVAALKLTSEQREQIRTIEDEVLFGWLRGVRPGTSVAGGKAAKERAIAVLTEEQVGRWQEMTGEPLKEAIAPFPPPPRRRARPARRCRPDDPPALPWTKLFTGRG